MLSINTNLNAQNAATQIGHAGKAVNTASERLTTGMRINKSADDVSGAALANRLENNSAKTGQFIQNANDGINLIQAADNAIKQQQDLVARMQALAYKAENGTNTTEDQNLIQKEFDQLAKEILRNEENNEFNDKKLLDGSMVASINVGIGAANQIDVSIQNAQVLSGAEIDPAVGVDVGAGLAGDLDINGIVIDLTTMAAPDDAADVNAATADEIAAFINKEIAALVAADEATTPPGTAADPVKDVTVKVVDNKLVFESTSVDPLTVTGGDAALIGIDPAAVAATARQNVIADDGTVNIQLSGHADGDVWKTEVHDKLETLASDYAYKRADVGASQLRLEFTIKNLEGTKLNLDSTLSQAQDTNFALETAALAKAKVLASTSQTMLSQANSAVEEVTQLLR